MVIPFHPQPSSFLFASLLIFISFCLAKVVLLSLYHFEENVFARYGSNCGWGGGVWRFCNVTLKLTWSPRRLFIILMIPSHQQFIGSQFYYNPPFYLQHSIIGNWSLLPFPQKTTRSYIILRAPFSRRRMMTSSQVSVISIYTYIERILSRQTRRCSLISDYICR